MNIFRKDTLAQKKFFQFHWKRICMNVQVLYTQKHHFPLANEYHITGNRGFKVMEPYKDNRRPDKEGIA